MKSFASEAMLKQIFVRSVKNRHSLGIIFLYQDKKHMYEKQSSKYISHLIDHGGSESILTYIKTKSLITELFAVITLICSEFTLFTISIALTENEQRKYQKMIKVVFQYIFLIKK